MRSEIQQLNDAHIALTEWANWQLTHMDRSCIGHAKRTVEGRAQHEAIGVQQSGFFQGRCPEVMMPRRIARTDHSVSTMPQLVRMAIWCKYCPERAEETDPNRKKHSGQWTEGIKIALFKDLTGQKYHDYYKLWDIGRAWVAAGIR